MFTTICIAAFGGLLINVMNLWEDLKKPKTERVPKDVLYWFFVVAWPLISAALAYIYILDGSTLRPLLALSLGLGAPTTIKSLMSAAVQPHAPPPKSEG
jgi:hypothetical protein